jgi:hypothetical protein
MTRLRRLVCYLFGHPAFQYGPRPFGPTAYVWFPAFQRCTRCGKPRYGIAPSDVEFRHIGKGW